MFRLFWILLLCWAGQSGAWGATRLPESGGKVPIVQGWDLLRDPQATLTVAQLSRPEIAAAFQAQHASPAIGYAKGAVWLRLTVLRPARAPSQWLLELCSPLLDDVTLFLPRASGGYEQRVAGDRQPFATRDVNYRNPMFRLDLPADQPVTVYLRVRSTSTLSFALVLWDPVTFISSLGTEMLLFGLFYAIHLVLLITCAWLYWSTRSVTYALFGLTVFAHMLTSLGAEGFTYQYLLRDAPLANDALYVASWFAAVPLGASFTLHYLGLFGSRWRRLALGFTVLAWAIALVCAPLITVINVWWLRPLYLLWSLAVVVILLLVAALMAARGQKSAWVPLFALSLHVVGVVLRLGRNVGWIEPGVVADNAHYLGMMASLLIMNSAINRRDADMRAQKEAAQAEALRVARQAERELERKVAQRTQALQEAMVEVEASLSLERRAQEEQRQFLATVSHELRTPLAVIDAAAQNLALDDEHGDPLTMARYQKILRATQRLAMLLDDSLNEDCFELLRNSSHPQPCSPKSLLDDAAAAARLLSEGRRLEVDGSALPESFVCDPSLLRLVLRTLADNAVKYTPAGSQVTLRGKAVAGGVELEVQDDGPGIAPADLPRVFDRHYRGQNAARTPGTGLGLPLARRMVEMQGGTLTLDSAPGQGCRATIFLPSAQPAFQPSERGAVKL